MTVELKPAKPAIDSLWKAFAAAQAEFGAIAKSATGARASQKYAPLDCVLDIVRPTLNAHGLVLTQVPVIDGDALLIRTVLVHSPTGETHECIYPAGPITAAHQALGAGVTYARRYSLLSLLGVFPADEDDDGEKAGAAANAPPQKILNPETGRMVDPKSAHQQRKNGSWEGFEARIHSFVKTNDLAGLEAFWADGDTQAKVDMWNAEWQRRAAEKYEHAQETILTAGAP